MLSFMTKQNTGQFYNHESDSDCSVIVFEALIESGVNLKASFVIKVTLCFKS